MRGGREAAVRRRPETGPGPAGLHRSAAPGTSAGTALLLAALTALSTAACQRPLPDEDRESRGTPLVERVAGCWELAPAGGGAAADTVRRWVEEGILPGVIRLDTVRAGTGSEGAARYSAWSYVYSRKTRRPFAAWLPQDGDSLRVETPGAMSGAVLRLAVRPDTLVGTATVFTDVVQPGDGGPTTLGVEAGRVSCPE